MKRTLFMLCVASTLIGSVGCNLANRRCNHCSGPVGCRPCNMGWQRGGTDYQRFLGCNNGCCGQTAGHGVGQGALAGMLAGSLPGHGNNFSQAQPAGAGPASGDPMAQVAYPYYTTRGPRDFFMDDPPTIGR